MLPFAATDSPARTTVTRAGAAAGCAAILLAGLVVGCGAPPEPLPTAPPRASDGGSAGPSGSAYPDAVVPSGLPTAPAVGLPTAPPGLPGGYPPPFGDPPPAVHPQPIRTTIPPRPTSTVPPAKKCSGGPTDAQILAVIGDRPGVPTDVEFTVSGGPYCAGSWHFATVDLKSADDRKYDPLLVVTRGKPAALILVEAGADVCSDTVQAQAPPGIRVRACGL